MAGINQVIRGADEGEVMSRPNYAKLLCDEIGMLPDIASEHNCKMWDKMVVLYGELHKLRASLTSATAGERDADKFRDMLCDVMSAVKCRADKSISKAQFDSQIKKADDLLNATIEQSTEGERDEPTSSGVGMAGDERDRFAKWYKENYPRISGTSSWVERAWATWQAALANRRAEAPGKEARNAILDEAIEACDQFDRTEEVRKCQYKIRKLKRESPRGEDKNG